MDKKDLYSVIGGFIFLIIAFFIVSVFMLTFGQNTPCDFSKISDLFDFFLFKILFVGIPLFYLIASVDLVMTKKLFKSWKRFIFFFGLIIVVFCLLTFIFPSNHCTFGPDNNYININTLKVGNHIKGEIKDGKAYGSIYDLNIKSGYPDEICFFKNHTLEISKKEKLLKTINLSEIQINEEPLCIELNDGSFRFRVKGFGDRTEIYLIE